MIYFASPAHEDGSDPDDDGGGITAAGWFKAALRKRVVDMRAFCAAGLTGTRPMKPCGNEGSTCKEQGTPSRRSRVSKSTAGTTKKARRHIKDCSKQKEKYQRMEQ